MTPAFMFSFGLLVPEHYVLLIYIEIERPMEVLFSPIEQLKM